MNKKPKISVIMATRNSEMFVDFSVQSIVDQTYDNFEFLIIDDGSSDNTFKLLEEHSRIDRRIILFKNKKSVGLTKCLNFLLKKSTGNFVARMDSDDISFKDRFQKQINFLKEKEYFLVGGNALRIDLNGNVFHKTNVPLDNKQIKTHAIFENPFIHPSIMFKKNDILYNEKFQTTQDWEMYIQIFKKGKVKNLSDFLIKQRIHSKSMSSSKRSLQIENSIKVQKSYLKDLSSKHISSPFLKKLNRTILNHKEKLSNNEINQLFKETIEISRQIDDSNIDNIYLKKIIYIRFLKFALKFKLIKFFISIFFQIKSIL